MITNHNQPFVTIFLEDSIMLQHFHTILQKTHTLTLYSSTPLNILHTLTQRNNNHIFIEIFT